jgi:hypothetical protein
MTMARIRSLKPEAFSSRDLCKVDIHARWTFAGLWCFADDEGRLEDNAKLICAQVYPRDAEGPEDVEKDLLALCEAGLLCRYEVDGVDYLHVVKFHHHQHPNKPQESKLPDCRKCHDLQESLFPSHDGSEWVAATNGDAATSIVRTPGGDRRGGDRRGGTAGLRPAVRRATQLPENWKPQSKEVEWAKRAYPGVDLRRETAKFCDYWPSQPGQRALKTDWDRTWRNWIRNAADRQPHQGKPPEETWT